MATKFIRMVVMTSPTPRRVRMSAGNSAQTAPATHEARRTAGRTSSAGRVPAFRPTQTPAMAPAYSCPSAPMFHTPARKAMATASPDRMSGTARTRVTEKRADGLPTVPRTMAPAACPGSNPPRRSATPATRTVTSTAPTATASGPRTLRGTRVRATASTPAVKSPLPA